MLSERTRLADGTTPERVRFAVAHRPGLKVVSGGLLVTSNDGSGQPGPVRGPDVPRRGVGHDRAGWVARRGCGGWSTAGLPPLSRICVRDGPGPVRLAATGDDRHDRRRLRALDAETEAEILDALGEIQRRDGVALVVVTHDPLIARRADRILEIRNGSIVASWAGSSPPSLTPGHLWPVVPNQDRAAEIPVAVPPAPAFEASARLGAALGAWLLSVSAWVVPALLMVLALNQGVALYQRHHLDQLRQAQAALEDAALLWLRADIEDVAYNGGVSYTWTLSLPAADEAFREGSEAPGMLDYGEYEEHRRSTIA